MPKKTVPTEKSLEDKILEFLSDKTGKVKLNSFLKELYPVKSNHAANIGNSRYIRGVLDKMQAEGKLIMVNKSHDRLGDTYYPDGINAAQYNLDTWGIEVEV